MTDTIQDVLTFWRNAGPAMWFAHDEAFDNAIRERFLPLYEILASNDHLLINRHPWELTPDGSLALIIVLDQFPRQIFRGHARAFATDPVARAVAHRALLAEHDMHVSTELRSFFYLPFMHSEDLADQERSLTLYEELGNMEGREYAKIHHDIIARFGRFPHRNPALGRQTTKEEQRFLNEGGFKG